MLYNTNYLKINSSIGFSVYKKVISQNGYRWLVLFFFQKTLNSFTDVVIIQMTTFQGFQQIILYKACLLTFTNSFIEFIWIYIISRSCIRSRHSHSILIKTEEFLTKSIHDNYTEDIFFIQKIFYSDLGYVSYSLLVGNQKMIYHIYHRQFCPILNFSSKIHF